MTQITRILTLYQRLIAGKVIDKTLFALEFDTTERSVDRDILAVRLFLSDSFSNLELIYDREQRGYRLENLRIKQEIALGECYLLSKLLLDSRLYSIEQQDQITLHFGKPYADEPCVPYSVEFRERDAYLVALELDSRTPVLFRLDDIKSYLPARQPYSFSQQEADDLQDLVERVCSGTKKRYTSYIYSKKKASE